MKGRSIRESESDAAAAERRRRALLAVLQTRGMSLNDAAAAAGLGSSSSIGNFLNGRTMSLNVATYEPLARHLRMTIDELVGRPQRRRRRALNGNGSEEVVVAFVRGAIATGEWLQEPFWSEDRWLQMKAPIDLQDFGESYYLRLDTEEMNQVYAVGAMLECVDIPDYKGEVKPGNKVIIHRTSSRTGLVEVMCREVMMDGDAMAVARSTKRRFRDERLKIAWPITPGNVETTDAGDMIEVKAVVVRIIRDEV